MRLYGVIKNYLVINEEFSSLVTYSIEMELMVGPGIAWFRGPCIFSMEVMNE